MRGLRAWVGFAGSAFPTSGPSVCSALIEQLAGQHGLGAPGDRLVLLRAARSDHWLAFFTTAAAIVAAIVEIVLRIVDPGARPEGLRHPDRGVLFVGGVQMICFSVIGSYMAHMYEEIKARPPYIVESVLNPPAGPGHRPNSSCHPPPRTRRLRRPSSAPSHVWATVADSPRLYIFTDGLRDLRARRTVSDELYPAQLDLAAFTPSVFSARRLPDRYALPDGALPTVRTRAIRPRARRRGAWRSSIGSRRSITAMSSMASVRLTAPRSIGWHPCAIGRNGILDVGCGSGFALELARDRGWQAVRGVEPSTDAIAKADSGDPVGDRPGRPPRRSVRGGSFEP